MDKLSRDATNAIAKGMTYGKYMAQKKPDIIIPTKPKEENMRECVRCGTLFPLNKQGNGTKKYCSDECREIVNRQRYYELHGYKAKEEKPEVHRICPVCGNDFVVKYRNHKYCRETCANFGKSERMKLVYQRKKERMLNGNNQVL